LIRLLLIEFLIENGPLLQGKLAKHLLLNIAIEVIPVAFHGEIFSFAHLDLARRNLLTLNTERDGVKLESPLVDAFLYLRLVLHFMNQSLSLLSSLLGSLVQD
jgi:hypothetical protein